MFKHNICKYNDKPQFFKKFFPPTVLCFAKHLPCKIII